MDYRRNRDSGDVFGIRIFFARHKFQSDKTLHLHGTRRADYSVLRALHTKQYGFFRKTDKRENLIAVNFQVN